MKKIDKELEKAAEDAIESIGVYSFSEEHRKQVLAMFNAGAQWQKERIKGAWKPNAEQMEALMLAIEGKGPAPTSYLSRRLEDLYEGLANTYGVECDFKED